MELNSYISQHHKNVYIPHHNNDDYINRTLVFDYKYVKFYFLLNKVYVIAIKNL
jgi:hypothetical protein